MPEAPRDARPPVVRIEGGGPVALAFASFLMRAGFDAAGIDIDLRSPDAAAPRDGGPRRHLALSEGSCQLLGRICALPDGGRIEAIDVTLADRSGLTTIRAGDFGLDRLGLVVGWPDLVASLRDAVAARLPPRSARIGDADPWVVVHADGAPPGEGTDTLDFAQSALLAEVATAPLGASAAGTAFERFDRNGPLALLPIGTARDRYSVVWCDTAEACERRAAQAAVDAQAIERPLAHAFGARLGRLRLDSPLEVVALRRRRRRMLARGNAVWIGNAAQTLHPVAGQGLNLGLRDAFELARALGDAGASARGRTRIGEPDALLRRFVASRSRDRATTIGLTDALARGFRFPSLHGLESAALTMLELAPALRRPLAGTLLFGRRA
ncbi:MAG: FAD-dependent monooxygenase [Lautropia sp.]